MYKRQISVDLPFDSSSGKQWVIKFSCELDPYCREGDATPVALFEDDEILFPENEDNESLENFLVKALGVSLMEQLSQKALVIACEKQESIAIAD